MDAISDCTLVLVHLKVLHFCKMKISHSNGLFMPEEWVKWGGMTIREWKERQEWLGVRQMSFRWRCNVMHQWMKEQPQPQAQPYFELSSYPLAKLWCPCHKSRATSHESRVTFMMDVARAKEWKWKSNKKSRERKRQSNDFEWAQLWLRVNLKWEKWLFLPISCPVVCCELWAVSCVLWLDVLLGQRVDLWLQLYTFSLRVKSDTDTRKQLAKYYSGSVTIKVPALLVYFCILLFGVLVFFVFLYFCIFVFLHFRISHFCIFVFWYFSFSLFLHLSVLVCSHPWHHCIKLRYLCINCMWTRCE